MTDLSQNVQDYAIVAGQKTPGKKIEIVGAALLLQWDKQKPSGSGGARLVKKGRDLCEFSIKLSMLDTEDWAAWDAFKPVLDAPPQLDASGRKVVAGMDFSHPVTDVVGIRSVVLKELVAPVQNDKGDWTIEVKFTEFREPEPAQARARGSRNTEAEDPVARQIDGLVTQFQELAAAE